MHAHGTVAVLARFGMCRAGRAGVVSVSTTIDDLTICAHWKGPVGENGTVIYACVHCLTRWCETCELVRPDNRFCLFCERNPLEPEPVAKRRCYVLSQRRRFLESTYFHNLLKLDK
jgi:hypothetical protein